MFCGLQKNGRERVNTKEGIKGKNVRCGEEKETARPVGKATVLKSSMEEGKVGGRSRRGKSDKKSNGRHGGKEGRMANPGGSKESL